MSFVLSKRKGLLLDLDNTLVPTALAFSEAMGRVASHLVERGISEDLAENVCRRFDVLLRERPIDPDRKIDYGLWRKGLWEQVMMEILDRSDVSDFSEDVYRIYRDTVMSRMVLDDVTKNLLVLLDEQYKLGILTNGDSALQRDKLEHCLASKYIQCIVVSGEEGMDKPDPRIFHLACRRLGLVPRQVVMVGDRLSTDIEGSNLAGLRASVWVRNGLDISCLGQMSRDKRPDYVIDSFHEIENVLEQIDFD